MNLIRLVIKGFVKNLKDKKYIHIICIQMVLQNVVIASGMSDPSSLEPLQKTLRNTIFSSVKNNSNSAPSSKSSIELSPDASKKLEMPSFKNNSSKGSSAIDSVSKVDDATDSSLKIDTSKPTEPKIVPAKSIDLKSIEPKKVEPTSLEEIIKSSNEVKTDSVDISKSQVDIPKKFSIEDSLPKLTGVNSDNAPKAESLSQVLSLSAEPKEIHDAKSAIKKNDMNAEPAVVSKAESLSDLLKTSDEAKEAQIPKALAKEFEAKNVEIDKSKEPNVLYQDKTLIGDDDPSVAFNFEDASLMNLLTYIENIYNIKFITEDIITGAKDSKGTPVTPQGIAGHKISFRTNQNLTRKESWDLFITFMHIAGLDVIPTQNEKFYRIVNLKKAISEPIPTYIGVDVNVLPESDMIIRYVYFSKNIIKLADVQKLINSMQGGDAKVDLYQDLRAFVFTDRASTIRSLMQIVTELDRAVMPEVVSVVRLKHADAKDVKALYATLNPKNLSASSPVKPWVQQRREPTLEYFPSDVALVDDKRTNSLIILGTAKDVKKVEEFITKYIDVSIERAAPPVFIYQLQYTNATDIATLLQTVVQYGSSTEAGKVGGVRDGVKFFGPSINIVPDKYTNSLIINAKKEDYEALLPLIKDLDVIQKQVGIEVLIVQVSDVDTKTLGAHISGPNGSGPNGSPPAVQGASPYGPTFAQAITAQTSGIPSGPTPIITTPPAAGGDDFSLKSSLASLLGSPGLNEVGSVLVTFGKPIWAIFKVLNTITSTHIISNPFLVATNNTPALVSSGEERRLVSGSVVSALGLTNKGYAPIDALLSVKITPQINANNMINLNVDVSNKVFTQTANTTGNDENSPTNEKHVSTNVTVANGETLVLGGIMSESYSTSSAGVPFLEHIPIFGWFFKSKTRSINRGHFMIFICPRVLDTDKISNHVDQYSAYKLKEVEQHLDLIDETDWFTSKRDPVHNAFFGQEKSPSLQQLYIKDTLKKRDRLDGKIDQPSKIKKSKKRYKKDRLASVNVFESDMNSPKTVTTKNVVSKNISPGKGAQHDS